MTVRASFAGRGLGWRPSPPKAAHLAPDLTLETGPIKLATTAPPSADNSDLVLSILNQGPLGSCTTNAAGQAVRGAQTRVLLDQGKTLDEILANPPPLFSRLFLYWLARARWGEAKVDSGTFIRSVFEALNDFGFCPESIWPYVTDDLDSTYPTFTLRPPTQAFIAAIDQHAPTTYVRVTSTGAQRVEEIKRAIASRYLVVFGTSVTEDFCTPGFDASAPVPRPSGTDAIAGGHAMVMAKYDVNGPYVPNSWGTSFGIGGWVQFGWDYITWDQTDDIWLVESAPQYARDLVAA